MTNKPALPTRQKKSKYPTPRLFCPINPHKYVGDVKNIVCRSNLERQFFVIFDKNPNVVNWGSEELIIKYFSPIDQKIHRYFPDCIVRIKTRSGKLEVYIIEIKPKSQCFEPKKKKNTKRFITEMQTWSVNNAKWRSATEFAEKNNCKFWVLTEEHLKKVM